MIHNVCSLFSKGMDETAGGITKEISKTSTPVSDQDEKQAKDTDPDVNCSCTYNEVMHKAISEEPLVASDNGRQPFLSFAFLYLLSISFSCFPYLSIAFLSFILLFFTLFSFHSFPLLSLPFPFLYFALLVLCFPFVSFPLFPFHSFAFLCFTVLYCTLLYFFFF